VCALAVFLERAGIATVVIGLTRLHIEKIRPPRALWVPFQLGRPLGGFTVNGQFKKEVLRAALALLERVDGPVILEDFPAEDPGNAADPRWQAPDLSTANSIADEVRLLTPLWHRGVERLGRTMVGLSAMPIELAADYLQRFDTADPAPNPCTDQSDLLRMRFCADDIGRFYAEAAFADFDPESDQIGDWFWSSTLAAKNLYRIQQNNEDHEDNVRSVVCGRLIVPGKRKLA